MGGVGIQAEAKKHKVGHVLKILLDVLANKNYTDYILKVAEQAVDHAYQHLPSQNT